MRTRPRIGATSGAPRAVRMGESIGRTERIACSILCQPSNVLLQHLAAATALATTRHERHRLGHRGRLSKHYINKIDIPSEADTRAKRHRRVKKFIVVRRHPNERLFMASMVAASPQQRAACALRTGAGVRLHRRTGRRNVPACTHRRPHVSTSRLGHGVLELGLSNALCPVLRIPCWVLENKCPPRLR